MLILDVVIFLVVHFLQSMGAKQLGPHAHDVFCNPYFQIFFWLFSEVFIWLSLLLSIQLLQHKFHAMQAAHCYVYPLIREARKHQHGGIIRCLGAQGK